MSLDNGVYSYTFPALGETGTIAFDSTFSATDNGHVFYGYVDTIAKESQIPDVSGKANTSDLPYAIAAVELGEWQFSDGQQYDVYVEETGDSWWLMVSFRGISTSSNESPYSTEDEANSVLSFSFDSSNLGLESGNVTATRTWTLHDRAINSVSMSAPGSGNTTIATFTMPSQISGKSRDFMLNFTFGEDATDSGDINLIFEEPAPSSGTTPSVSIDFGSSEDVSIGRNLILFTEIALPSSNPPETHWLVTVKHQDFAS